MIRQPLQRLSGMQASDIDIYRRVTREKTHTMVRAVCVCVGGGGPAGRQAGAAVVPGVHRSHHTRRARAPPPAPTQLTMPTPHHATLHTRRTPRARRAATPHQAKYLAATTGKDEETIMADFSRPKYFSPFEAADYGIIDQVCAASTLGTRCEHSGRALCPLAPRGAHARRAEHQQPRVRTSALARAPHRCWSPRAALWCTRTGTAWVVRSGSWRRLTTTSSRCRKT
jgi:hypothetical protein